MMFMHIYVLTQITLFSNRLATLPQQLAIQQAKAQAPDMAHQSNDQTVIRK